MKLSIILYFHEISESLNDLIDNLLNQSIVDIELLLAGFEGLKQYPDWMINISKGNTHIKMIPISVKVQQAWNAGLEMAEGEYIHFLNGNDCVLEYAYEAIYVKAVSKHIDLILFCNTWWDEAAKAPVCIPEYDFSGLTDGEFHVTLDANRLSQLYTMQPSVWMGLYRRDFLTENGIRFEDIALAEKAFFYKAISLGKFMIARDYLVVHKEECHIDRHTKESLTGIEELISLLEKYYVDNLLSDDSFEACLVNFLEEYVLKAKALCQKAISQRESQGILDHTGSFVRSLHYRFIDQIIRQYNAMSRDIRNYWKEKDSGIEKDFMTEDIEILSSPFLFEKKEKPKVSIVVPIYNQENYLNQALYSLKKQTLTDIEFLCVNDGSTDGSLAILKEYADADKRFIIINKENTGYGHSLNVGIESASGEYIGILEPDDFIGSDMYRYLYKIAHEKKLDVIRSDFYRFWVDKNGGIRQSIARCATDISFYNRVLDTSNEEEAFRFIIYNWTGIYRKSFIDQWHIRFHESPGAAYQDQGFSFLVLARAKRAWFVRKPFYRYRIDNPYASTHLQTGGKYHAILEEYDYIKGELEHTVGDFKKFERVFYLKQFEGCYITTYYRLAEEEKLSYLYRMQEIFKRPVQENRIDEKIFGEKLWKILLEIVEDPKAFFEKTRISVVLATRNNASSIRRCLDSVLAKNELRLEVLCMDLGSEDATYSILEEYQTQDPRIHIQSSPNKSIGRVLNDGIKQAKGEAIVFLNPEWFYEPELFRRAYTTLHVDDKDIIVVKSDVYDEDQEIFQDIRDGMRKELLPVDRPFAGVDIMYNAFEALGDTPWDKMYRKDFLLDNHLFFLEELEDVSYFANTSLVRAKKIITINMKLVHRVYWEKCRETTGVLEECIDVLLELKSYLVENNIYSRFEQDYINYASIVCMRHSLGLHGFDVKQPLLQTRNNLLGRLNIEKYCDNKLFFYDEDVYDWAQAVKQKKTEYYSRNLAFKYFQSKETIKDQIELASKKEEQIRIKSDQISGCKEKLKTANLQKIEANRKIKSVQKQLKETQEQLDDVQKKLLAKEEKLDSISNSTSYKVARKMARCLKIVKK